MIAALWAIVVVLGVWGLILAQISFDLGHIVDELREMNDRMEEANGTSKKIDA